MNSAGQDGGHREVVATVEARYQEGRQRLYTIWMRASRILQGRRIARLVDQGHLDSPLFPRECIKKVPRETRSATLSDVKYIITLGYNI